MSFCYDFDLLGSSMFSVSPSRPIVNISDEEGVDSTLGLGELAQLTVNNDTEGTYEVIIFFGITVNLPSLV